jgi:hypothetical protein
LSVQSWARIFGCPCGGMDEWFKSHAWKACVG